MNSKGHQLGVRCGVRLMTAVVLSAWLVGCGAPGPLMPDQQPVGDSGNRPPPAPEAVRVSRGDTLYSIAFRYGLDWRDVAGWNGIAAPYTIHVDDWIRLQPQPDMRPAVVAATPSPPVAGRSAGSAPAPGSQAPAETASRPDSEPDTDQSGAASANAPEDPGTSGADAGEQAPPEPEPAVREPPRTRPDASVEPPSGPTRSVAGVTWRWPTRGRITRRFDAGASRKGILIAGELGQQVRSAARGEVVYSGNGLIGYGELIIIKHSDRMLSAYAHNRERLVAEGERVASGQLIARMGSNERDETVLHFEIRQDGKPSDPVNYLPRR
ncbi:MAG: peptidoglycan DD-metalloendopeptidase family protein [Wenzhouxiangellaceae bacterium]|nr:peptidoglycan DD-metalloendopeptidase family protein [Wenzhouxiangellaceae bacterium]MBS3745428.1 peptidoglycan DD-metalloendopeptidase family protein [Wenzhouxiangellaceae bacterium]